MLTIAACIFASSPQLWNLGAWALAYLHGLSGVPATDTAPSSAMSAPSSPRVCNELSGLRAGLHECWSLPSGLTDMRPVTVIIRLNEDGTVSSPPQSGSTADKAMADSVVRAITRCQPYAAVARAGYREIEIVFSPVDR